MRSRRLVWRLSVAVVSRLLSDLDERVIIMTIDQKDVTQRAIDGGWTLPPFWTVTAEISPDCDSSPDEFDCYSPDDITAWRNDEWRFVVVCVFVEDADERLWGNATLGGVEHGCLDQVDIDALTDKPGEYSVVREHDMIREALEDAVSALADFGTPVITSPDGITVTGL